jgi:hypothetical protein
MPGLLARATSPLPVAVSGPGGGSSISTFAGGCPKFHLGAIREWGSYPPVHCERFAERLRSELRFASLKMTPPDSFECSRLVAWRRDATSDGLRFQVMRERIMRLPSCERKVTHIIQSFRLA